MINKEHSELCLKMNAALEEVVRTFMGKGVSVAEVFGALEFIKLELYRESYRQAVNEVEETLEEINKTPNEI